MRLYKSTKHLVCMAAFVAVVLGGMGVDASAQPWPPVPGIVGPPPGFPVKNRACLDDQYFVDVPIWANPTWTSATTFASTLTTAIANVRQSYWFCSGMGCTAPAVVVTPLLANRPSTDQTWRNDGDRRFFRVKFTRRIPGGVETVPVLPNRVCEVVTAIRTVAQAQAGAVPLFVGRECDASSMGSVESVPSTEMVDWPKIEMGAPAGQAASSGNVDIALLDSGVDPLVAAANDIAIAQAQSFVGSTSLHPHGTAMALFLRQLAPKAKIYDARVLSTDGHGTGKVLAEALDWALFEKRQIGRPMVVNLSVGWPEHNTGYAWVSGIKGSPATACSDFESPFGEPIRYLLSGARKGGIATVVAAAGNDPSTGDHEYFAWTPTPPAPLALPPACAALTRGSRWLYPARWDDQASCFTDGVTRYAAFGASAIDARRQSASTGIIGQEALIVAPGEHVYAKHSAAQLNSGTLLCTSNTEPPGVSLPRVFSGSSVSAAYVSGAVARAQDAWVNKTGQALTPSQALKLVYLTGETLCRAPVDKIVRRVSLPRLDATIANQTCGQRLLACSDSGELTQWDTFNNCKSDLVACGLEQAVPTCLPLKNGIDWPAGYSQTICGGVHGPNSDVPGQCGPGGNSCPFEELPSTIELGSLGPQPHTGGCPECNLRCSNGITNWVLKAQINNYIPTATSLSQPMLAVSSNDGLTTTWLNLTPYLSSSSAWKKGAYVQVNIPAYMIPTAACSSFKGNFWITEYWGSIVVAQNFSPLMFVNY